jgi:hypothetical protein
MKEDCKYKVTKTFPSVRAFTALSLKHEERLVEIMKEIDEWVYDTNSEDKLIFQL